MSIDFDSAVLTISTRGRESVADLTEIIDALDGLLAAAVWGALADPHSDDENILQLRALIKDLPSSPKRSARFYPQFGGLVPQRRGLEIEYPSGFWPIEDFDPFDPLDASVQYGLNKWLKITIKHADPKLYRNIFSVASIEKLEHRSPLVMEVGLAMGLVVTSTIALMFACMRAASMFRRWEAEADIREAEVAIKREEAHQAQLRTRMLEHLAESVQDLSFSKKGKEIPAEVLVEVARVATYPISELANSPLIDKIGLSVDLKK